VPPVQVVAATEKLLVGVRNKKRKLNIAIKKVKKNIFFICC
jgi:hypothetical protein